MQTALELKPDYPDAYNNLGISLKELGRFDEAEVYLRRAIELNPQFAEAYNNLGNALKELGRIEEAIGWHHEALRQQARLCGSL